MPERPIRGCDVCGQQDDHPRHVQPQQDGRYLCRHLDCCAAAGCPVCAETEKATKGARGDKLLKAIQSGALDEVNV